PTARDGGAVRLAQVAKRMTRRGVCLLRSLRRMASTLIGATPTARRILSTVPRRSLSQSWSRTSARSCGSLRKSRRSSLGEIRRTVASVHSGRACGARGTHRRLRDGGCSEFRRRLFRLGRDLGVGNQVPEAAPGSSRRLRLSQAHGLGRSVRLCTGSTGRRVCLTRVLHVQGEPHGGGSRLPPISLSTAGYVA